MSEPMAGWTLHVGPSYILTTVPPIDGSSGVARWNRRRLPAGPDRPPQPRTGGYGRLAQVAWQAGRGLTVVAFGTVLLATVVPLALISTIGALVETVSDAAAQGLYSPLGRQALGWAALAD
ncbi:hypothetical protein [Streptomyces silaceus]|uniref:hypothetical protein n=1 Tax=Streptomyces silaceus TaxID=545123 RepID=UPI0006EBC3F2|nr:hypothetical protein [Streptomyces silaceus]